MTIKTKFKKEYEKLYKSINLKVERDFICEGFLKGSLSAFESEIEGLGFTRWVRTTANEERIRNNAEKHFEELNKDIEFCKKKLEEFK